MYRHLRGTCVCCLVACDTVSVPFRISACLCVPFCVSLCRCLRVCVSMSSIDPSRYWPLSSRLIPRSNPLPSPPSSPPPPSAKVVTRRTIARHHRPRARLARAVRGPSLPTPPGLHRRGVMTSSVRHQLAERSVAAGGGNRCLQPGPSAAAGRPVTSVLDSGRTGCGGRGRGF